MLATPTLNGHDPDHFAFVPDVLVCIPAFNEGDTIGEIVRSAKAFGTRVLVCDDGSSDDTSLEASKNGAFVIRHPTNQGKGAALRTLLREATRFHHDVLVTLDGDGQHNPADLPQVVGPVLEGAADIVIGSRFSEQNRIPLYRRVGNAFLSALTNWSAGTKIRDTQSGFRAYSSRVIPNISIRGNGIGVDSEILVRVANRGFRITERGVSVTYEGNTSTYNPISHLLRVVSTIVRTHLRSRTNVGWLVWVLLIGTAASLFVSAQDLVESRISPTFTVSALGLSTLGLAAVLNLNSRMGRWARRTR